MTFTKTLTVALFSIAATGAFAKGHDQSQGADGTPGANAGSETVAAAQTLGATLGNGQDKSGKTRGKSGQANVSGTTKE